MGTTSSASDKKGQKPEQTYKMPDPVKLAQVLYRVSEQCQKIVGDYLIKYGPHSDGKPQPQEGMGMGDPANIGGAFAELGQRLWENPSEMYQSQLKMMNSYNQLWQNTFKRMMGETVQPVIQPISGDRRFKDEAWEQNAWFDYLKQAYLIWAEHMMGTVGSAQGLDKKTAHKIDFYTRQYVDALSPSNFLLTNPEVIRSTMESGGDNLVRGLENLLQDFERGKGKLAIKMSDDKAFEVGKNIAITPGKVVFQNDFLQLIQYDPSTEQVYKTPLLIMPPWINKYYILDLKPENSFVKWAVDQGHTVFMVSWVNPTAKYRDESFEDYMEKGALAAIDAVAKATGEEDVNAIGYCIGGTLLASTLAYLAAKGKPSHVKSATFFTTLLDFSDPGDLGVFIDEEQLVSLEKRMKERGYLDGSEMATTFNMLRANDLIWSFVINNYLLGKDPFPFDLLYWNSDSTRLPCAMHSFYLRKMYQKNLLAKPNGISLKGTGIDLSKVKTPSFFISTREDHIAPWKTTYKSMMLLGGPKKFTLAASGHIAGVVNHPARQKYSHWIYEGKTPPESSDAWFKGSVEHQGSWWPEWNKWVSGFGGGKIKARKPGSGKLKALMDAPGSYVKSKS